MADFSLSPSQERVLTYIDLGQNVLVTGGAGTGKSYLLHCLREEYGADLHLTASTGIAAVGVGGVTLHSWAGLGLGTDPVEVTLKRLARNKKKRETLQSAKFLAIDEVSMLSGEIFDKLNLVLKNVRKSNLPFGGLQMILFGDFLQLPPVFKRDNFGEGQPQGIAPTGDISSQYLFESDSWQEGRFEVFVLEEVFRQKEERFVELLNNLRQGKIIPDDLEILKDRMGIRAGDDGLEPVKIVTHNVQADRINQDRLGEIDEDVRRFSWSESGDDNFLKSLRKNCMAPQELELKIGAQVMMLKNVFQEEGIVNGSQGVVVDFSEAGYPVIEFSNGVEKEIKTEEWGIEAFNPDKNDMENKASIVQVPLRLAWAITVHKSQGMTLDRISCDLSFAFSAGQVYTALSRVRDLSGLFLEGFDPRKIMVDKRVLDFYEGRGI